MEGFLAEKDQSLEGPDRGRERSAGNRPCRSETTPERGPVLPEHRGARGP